MFNGTICIFEFCDLLCFLMIIYKLEFLPVCRDDGLAFVVGVGG